LLDEGSTDRSGTICDEYAKKDPHIHVIHQENEGVSDSWNEAMKHVRGEYTGFVDGDDLIYPRMYELLIRAIQDTGCEVAYCDYKKFSEEKDTDFFQDNQADQKKRRRINLHQHKTSWQITSVSPRPGEGYIKRNSLEISGL